MDVYKWCKKHGINNFTLNSNGEICVDGNVDIMLHGLNSLPFKFGHIKGNFICSHNSIESLLNSPRRVDGSFQFSSNRISSLIHCPEYVGGHFVMDKNILTSLKYFPDFVGGNIQLQNNQINSIKGLPNEVNGKLFLNNNLLCDVKYLPKKISGNLSLHRNPLETLIDMPSFPYKLMSLIYTNLSDVLVNFCKISLNARIVLCKYQMYYDIWTPEFNESNFEMFVEDFKDGLE